MAVQILACMKVYLLAAEAICLIVGIGESVRRYGKYRVDAFTMMNGQW